QSDEQSEGKRGEVVVNTRQCGHSDDERVAEGHTPDRCLHNDQETGGDQHANGGDQQPIDTFDLSEKDERRGDRRKDLRRDAPLPRLKTVPPRRHVAIPAGMRSPWPAAPTPATGGVPSNSTAPSSL